MLPAETSFPLCSSGAVCSRLLQHLSWASGTSASPGQHWHLLVFHGCTQVRAGQLWIQQQAPFSTDFQGLSRSGSDGPFAHHCSTPARSERCHWGNTGSSCPRCLLPSEFTCVSCPPGEGGRGQQAPLACTGCLWAVPQPCERWDAVHTAGTPSATSATPLSYFNTKPCLFFFFLPGSKKPAGFPERSVSRKAHCFANCLFWRRNCQMRGMSRGPGLPSVCCHPWGQTQQAAPVGKSTGDTVKHSIWFQLRRKHQIITSKRSRLLIPGGPSKCLCGFLKVLGSEGPTWVSSALCLPACEWRNRWAEATLSLNRGFEFLQLHQ